MLELSASEQVDVLSIEAGDIEGSSPLNVPTYKELVEVVTCDVVKLNISWPRERQEEHVKSKLDECFLQYRSQPQCQGLVFFPDLHNEFCKSWTKPYSSQLSNTPVLDYSNIVGENGYGMMPRVEEALASYLSLEAVSSMKAMALPTKLRELGSISGVLTLSLPRRRSI